MGKHLVFYDGVCGLCDHAVQFVLRHDRGRIFIFAPLQGVTAEEVLKGMPVEYRDVDSLVLVENYKEAGQRFYIYGKGALRICWLLGGVWALLGWISFLPSFLYDWGYRIVARNRHFFFRKDVCALPDPNQRERFLP